MKIHSLYILKSSGIPLYVRYFTEDFQKIDTNLLTPFFSAIFTFSESLVSRKLEELEMSGLRFTIKEENEFIFVLLSDQSVSTLFTSTRLIGIADAFFREYYQLDKLREFTQIENPKFDKIIDSIIKGEEEMPATRKIYPKIIDLFTNLILQNEIVGASLLNAKGSILYNSLPDNLLLNSIRELEIRFISGTLTLPEMFYSLENGQKVFSSLMTNIGVFNFFIVLLFDKSIPLGMCEVNLFKIRNSIEKLIRTEIDQIH
ncbi:MAG: hypothetical protein EU532_10830 [Promethearchaeota archaeon]|nr:MAG: hypothetical protein EU532_10830 [Candidatus Lokiarchaeota archaeon]